MQLTFLGTGSAMPTGERMQAGLLLEGALHFLVVNPDNVATVDHAGFTATAVLTTGSDALLVVVAGLVLLARARAGVAGHSPIDFS